MIESLKGKRAVMKKNSIILLIILGSLYCAGHAAYKMVCLEKAHSGQDQKLYGHYHTSYATADNYHCYFAFDPKDIIWIPFSQAIQRKEELKDLPYLPSYQAKVIYFINAKPYETIIEALQKPGKTVKHLKSLEGNAGAPELKNYKEVQEIMPKLPE